MTLCYAAKAQIVTDHTDAVGFDAARATDINAVCRADHLQDGSAFACASHGASAVVEAATNYRRQPVALPALTMPLMATVSQQCGIAGGASMPFSPMVILPLVMV